jgi:hypothetical protein
MDGQKPPKIGSGLTTSPDEIAASNPACNMQAAVNKYVSGNVDGPSSDIYAFQPLERLLQTTYVALKFATESRIGRQVYTCTGQH